MTFGGGYAMLPFLQREITARRGWASEAELADYYAIGQCTPGIIAVNTATFVGYKRCGVVGGIFATLGLVFPSMVVIGAVATVLGAFAENAYVRHAFAGIQICVCVLILNAVIKFWKTTVKDRASLVICLVVMLGAALLDISPIFYVLLGAAAGLLIGHVRGRTK